MSTLYDMARDLDDFNYDARTGFYIFFGAGRELHSNMLQVFISPRWYNVPATS